MRQVREALHQGPREVWHAVTGLPHRHPFWLSSICAAALAVIFLGGLYSAHEEIRIQRQQLVKVRHSANVCGRQAIHDRGEARACAARLRDALIVCRLYRGCREALLAVRRPLRASERHRSVPPPSVQPEGGGPQTPVSHPGQQPGGGAPPHHTAPAPPAPAPTPAAPEPLPQPQLPPAPRVPACEVVPAHVHLPIC